VVTLTALAAFEAVTALPAAALHLGQAELVRFGGAYQRLWEAQRSSS